MKIPVNFGGGSSGSDDVTATAAQVLTPYTAITSESDDEPVFGTMADYAGTTQSGTSSLDTTNSRLRLKIPAEGRYTTASYIYQTYSDIRSLIGYTDASKVLSGTTFLGLAGTMTDKSGTTTSATASLDTSNSRVRMAIPTNGYYNTSAYLYTSYSNMRTLIGYTDASKVLSGTTFLGLAGTMSDRSGTTSSATSSLDTSNSRLRLQIPSNGYYNTSAYLYASYSNIRSLIGLSASILKYGETVLGVTGTWNGYVATSSDLYYGGSVGSLCGSMGTYSNDNCTVSAGASCVTLESKAYTAIGSNNFAGISFSTSLNCGAYSKITLTYNNTTGASSSSSITNPIYLCLYSSRPTSYSGFTDYSYYARATPSSGTTTGSTLTLDISGISSNLYVGVYLLGSYSGSSYQWTCEVTRIQVS